MLRLQNILMSFDDFQGNSAVLYLPSGEIDEEW
ncbi:MULTISPECIES: hypothetical protein [Corynebacterium]